MRAQRRNNSANNTSGGTTGGVTTITQEPKHEESGVPVYQPSVQQNTPNGQQQQQSPINQTNGNVYYQPQQPQPPQPGAVMPQEAYPPQQMSPSYAAGEYQQPQQPVNMYGGGSGPQASYPGPESQSQQFGYSEMGHSEPSRDQTVSPELQGSNGPAGSH